MHSKLFWRNIIWALVIFILCSIPGNDLPHAKIFNIPYFDKFVHFGMFFVMGIFLNSELRFQTRLKPTWIGIIIFTIILVYGGIIEILQDNFFINRSGDWVDLAADVAGGIVSIFCFPWLKKQKDLLLESKPFNQISFLRKLL